jgi:hypothetical protein
MWDYIGEGVPDLATDYPAVLFTGRTDDDDCPWTVGTMDDIFLADWTGSAWDVALDSGCPEVQIVDMHDPGVIPLPGGEFKVYVRNDATPPAAITIYYWDGDAWEDDTSDAVFYLDDGGTTLVDPGCVGNVDAFARFEGGVALEGMMVQIAEADPDTGDWCGVGLETPGIYFAELSN